MCAKSHVYLFSLSKFFWTLTLIFLSRNHVSSKEQEYCGCLPYNASLELVFVVDCSDRQVLNEFKRIVSLVDQLADDYPNSRFGITYFSDWPNHYWRHLTEPIPNTDYHTDPEGCYKRLLPLTPVPAEVKKNAGKIPVMISGKAESAVAGMSFTSADNELHWSDEVDLRENGIRKILVLITNQKTIEWKVPDIPKVRLAPNFDGTDTCSDNRNPTNEEASLVLISKWISVFAILFDGEVDKASLMTHWNTVGKELKVVFDAMWGVEKNPKIYAELKKFIGEVSVMNTIRSLNE